MSKLEEIEEAYGYNATKLPRPTYEEAIVTIRGLISRVRELETKVEQFENGITYYDKVQELVSRILNLEADLKLNASMLAKQCDIARGAEARVKELQDAIERHYFEMTMRTQGFGNDWVDTELYAHLAKSFEDIDK